MYKEIRFDVLAKIHSKRVLSNEKTYLLRNQLPVRLMVGEKQHIPDILYIERMSYDGATPWGRTAVENDMLYNPKSL